MLMQLFHVIVSVVISLGPVHHIHLYSRSPSGQTRTLLLHEFLITGLNHNTHVFMIMSELKKNNFLSRCAAFHFYSPNKSQWCQLLPFNDETFSTLLPKSRSFSRLFLWLTFLHPVRNTVCMSGEKSSGLKSECRFLILTSNHCRGNRFRDRPDSAHSQYHGALIVVVLRALEQIDSIRTAKSGINWGNGYGHISVYDPGCGGQGNITHSVSIWKKNVCEDVY